MTVKQFFSKDWFRSTLIEAILEIEANYNHEPVSFNDLRLKLAELLFGKKYVESNEFKKLWIQSEIETLEFCIKRDSKNLEANNKVFGKNMYKGRKSGLPDDIRENKEEIVKLKKELELIQ